jgi:hypothetical protein
VRRLADVSAFCGRGGSYHDGPVFSWGAESRPADFLQQAPAYPAGLCVDATIGLRSALSVSERERAKRAKYAPQLAGHPHLGFAVFAVDSAGAMGREADGIVGDWTRSLAHTRSAVGMPAGDARAEVLGRTARVRVMVSQTLAWARMDAGG